MNTSERIEWLDIDRIVPSPGQPRKRFDPESIDELAASIGHAGMLQPIVVRPVPGTCRRRFEIVAGERRWRAAQRAGLHRVPVVVRNLDDEDAALAALVENLQRQDLSLLEEARAVERLVREFGMTHQEVAGRCGYGARDRVTHLLRILKLPTEVLGMLEDGILSFGHAKLLAGLPVAEQSALAREAAARRWSVAALARHVRRRQEAQDAGHPRQDDPNIRELEQRVSEIVGAETRVEFQPNTGRGCIRFTFHSLEQLEGILERLGWSEEA